MAGQCKVGDTVSWRGQRGTMRGVVEKVLTEGALEYEGASVPASPDDPAVLIRRYRKGQPSDRRLATNLSALPDYKMGGDVSAQEMFGAVMEMSTVPPNIGLPSGVSVDKLSKALGRSPLFVTLPIGVSGASRNGRKYGARAMTKLAEQVNTKRPEGRWGHLSADQAASQYEPPAVRWLSAVVDEQGVAWGKLVALTEEAERHFAAAEATGARVGTSVYGFDPVTESNEIVDYRLVTIDLANPERVGVPITAAFPLITAEMAGSAPAESLTSKEAEEDMERIAELEAQLAEAQSKLAASDTQLKTVTEQLDASQKQNEQLVAESQQLLKTAIEAAIDEKVKVPSAIKIVRELVDAKNPTSRESVDKALAEVLEKDSIKELLAAQAAADMGGSIKPPVNSQTSGIETFLELPKMED